MLVSVSQIAPPDDGAALYALIAILVLLLVASGVILMKVRQNVKRMSSEHDRLMRTVLSRRNELEAALSSMVEGVLAVDLQQRVISINRAAAKLLNVRSDRITGKQVDQVLRNEPLRRFVHRALATAEPIQDDITLSLSNAAAPTPRPAGERERLFQAQGAELRDTDGVRIGALIVLHDVTRLRRLEVVRQDFVTNASHEIKTPVTAIKAAAETLLDSISANGDSQTRRFMDIIVRQSDRLQAIVEDLLSLARLEEEATGDHVPLERGRVAEVMHAAAETCAARADGRRSRVEVRCDPQLAADLHAPLLEQALINLIDNAIKYSGESATVRVTAERIGGEVIIAVQDEGPGIAPEHLPRIFERFYRTDKARSRALGGTGLGLSIVKHIALAHGGRVSVDSQPGKGSTFRIHLPLGA